MRWRQGRAETRRLRRNGIMKTRGSWTKAITYVSVAGLVCGLTLFATFRSAGNRWPQRSEEHTSELQSRLHLVCRLLLEKKKIMCHFTYATSAAFSFFFNDTATTEIYTLSLHDALPIWTRGDSKT